MEGGRLEEFFRRRKSVRNEPARPHQPLNSLPHLLIIVDDRDNSGILQLLSFRFKEEPKLLFCRARSVRNVWPHGTELNHP
jgi:hypothetical protein